MQLTVALNPEPSPNRDPQPGLPNRWGGRRGDAMKEKTRSPTYNQSLQPSPDLPNREARRRGDAMIEHKQTLPTQQSIPQALT